MREVDGKRGIVVLEGADGEAVSWRPRQVAASRGAVEVYRAEPMELRAGDRIRWTRNDAVLGLVNSHAAEVTAVRGDRVSFLLEGGCKLELGRDDPQLRHVDHAWASTVHAFQGRTVDNVIAVMEANHPHLTTQKSFYVEISRARHRAELVTDDAKALCDRLEAATGGARVGAGGRCRRGGICQEDGTGQTGAGTRSGQEKAIGSRAGRAGRRSRDDASARAGKEPGDGGKAGVTDSAAREEDGACARQGPGTGVPTRGTGPQTGKDAAANARKNAGIREGAAAHTGTSAHASAGAREGAGTGEGTCPQDDRIRARARVVIPSCRPGRAAREASVMRSQMFNPPGHCGSGVAPASIPV